MLVFGLSKGLVLSLVGVGVKSSMTGEDTRSSVGGESNPPTLALELEFVLIGAGEDCLDTLFFLRSIPGRKELRLLLLEVVEAG